MLTRLRPNVRRKLRAKTLAERLGIPIPDGFNPLARRDGPPAHELYRRLQHHYGLPETGRADPATLDILYPWRVKAQEGVDISDYQAWLAPLFFAKLRLEGVRVVIAKASEGTAWRSKKYPAFRLIAKTTGLQFGAYHFARPALSSGLLQAARFVAASTPKPGDVVGTLDLEDAGGLSKTDLEHWVVAFCTEYRRLTGTRPTLYANRSFIPDHLPANTRIASFAPDLWIADLSSAPGKAPPVHPYTIAEHQPSGHQYAFGERGGKDGLDRDLFAPGKPRRLPKATP